MSDHRKDAIASIETAKSELEHALEKLGQLSPADPSTIRYAVHALNNYLTVTSVCTDLLMTSLSLYPDEQVCKWLEGIAHATKLMRQTLRLLTNASVVSQVQLLRDEIDLVRLARRATEYYGSVARDKGIEVTFDSSMTSACTMSDGVAIAAVLDNLLSNAIKFSEAGKRVRVSVAQEPHSLVCSVEDEGPGLSREDQAELFKRGAQLTPAPTGGEPSTGYGLAVAKDLVDKLNGEIWCVSELGRGSRFSFRLPLCGEESGKASSPSAR
ncbi:MAG: sensor histidine kinase [Chloroflexota bacterium]